MPVAFIAQLEHFIRAGRFHKALFVLTSDFGRSPIAVEALYVGHISVLLISFKYPMSELRLLCSDNFLSQGFSSPHF